MILITYRKLNDSSFLGHIYIFWKLKLIFTKAAAVFQLTKILMSYYLPGKFDTLSPGSGLEGYATSLVKVILFFMTRNFSAFLFIISGGVNCTSVSGTTWEGGEGRHLQNEGVHQEHLQWRHLHLREDHGSLRQTRLRGGAGSELRPRASPPGVQSCAGRRGRTAPTSPSITTARAWWSQLKRFVSAVLNCNKHNQIIMCPFKLTFYLHSILLWYLWPLCLASIY